MDERLVTLTDPVCLHGVFDKMTRLFGRVGGRCIGASLDFVGGNRHGWVVWVGKGGVILHRLFLHGRKTGHIDRSSLFAWSV